MTFGMDPSSQPTLGPVPAPRVIIGCLLGAHPLPVLPGVTVRNLTRLGLGRIRVPAGPQESRARGTRPKPSIEHGHLIDPNIDREATAAMLRRGLSAPSEVHSPVMLIGHLSPELADLATIAEVAVHAREPHQAGALPLAFRMAAWLARRHVRRHPQHRIVWAMEQLAPWAGEALGAFGLTPRQLEVVALASLGVSQRDTAAALGVNPRTVERMVAEVLERTGAARLENVVGTMETLVTAEVQSGGERPEIPVDRSARRTPSLGNPVPNRWKGTGDD